MRKTMDIRKKRLYSLIGLAIILILILLLPFEIPYSIKVLARIYPQQEWSLKRDPSGTFFSEMTNNMTGFKNEFTNYEFERGDIANIHINNNLQPNSFVRKGDTIAHISSLLLKEQIANLKNELQIEYANLEASKSGSKIADIKVIEEELDLARQKYNQTKRKFNRINTLFSDSIIPDETFETTEDNMKVAEIEVKILERRLTAAKTGQKPESINLIWAKINSLEQQIRHLQNRQLNYSIISPLSGMVDFNESNNDLIRISTAQKYIVSAPIKVGNRKYIDTNTRLDMNISGLDSAIVAENLKVENIVGVVNNKQVVMIKAPLKLNPGIVTPGMVIECTVVCQPVSLIEYFTRSTKIIF